MTICYDCNHSLFSRMYGVAGVDIIVNSTGGDVVYDKWHKYNRGRAIENNSYVFVTMGGDGTKKNPHTYVFGFNSKGGELVPINFGKNDEEQNHPGNIYVYDIASDKDISVPDNSLNQKMTENKNCHIKISVANVNEFLAKSENIVKDLYLYKHGNENIVFCVVNGEEIIQPENVLKLLYAKELKGHWNRRYIIVNRFSYITQETYENVLSTIWKVRSMEKFCALIVESDNLNLCYQCGKNRTAQVLKPVDGKFEIDLDRTTGPEAIWKDKNGMKASWRVGYEWLLSTVSPII